MNKKVIRVVLVILLCLCIAVSFIAPAFAAGTTVKIQSAEDLLSFAEACRTDTYSEGITVELMCDIDLSGIDFKGIPVFNGIFKGNGFTISGVSITEEGSVQGFFRYVQEKGEIYNLNIKGDVLPEGSKNVVGGIVGSNMGRIENCSFEGAVNGADRVGGIAGENKLSGMIIGCQVHGNVVANHFAGGIAGENQGVIRNGKNAAKINTTVSENQIGLSDITVETLIDTEAANVTTDIGGIAGRNSGVVRGSANYGDVGYKLMGYNIGGVVGSHSGYMTGCTNHGKIYGRKDVGGIIGHMEPVTNVQYSEDAIQMLEEQMETLSGMADGAYANAQSGANNIADKISDLEDYANNAKEAIKMLQPDSGFADLDTILAAQSKLSENLRAIPGAIDGITEAIGDTVSGVTKNLEAVAGQLSTVGVTMGSASENLGIAVADISDNDTENDLLGKAENCKNSGEVFGDMNIGGVVGIISYANDLETEGDISVNGDISLNVAGEIRAVVLNCSNEGSVTVRKQYGGGIIGLQTLGLVKGCGNTGSVGSASASYVGGVAGSSYGFLRLCTAKCFVSGDVNVGGIAGEGVIVSDCRSMVSLDGGEKVGAIIGYSDKIFGQTVEDANIFGNYYLAVNEDHGAVDGISYGGFAQELSHDEFFALSGVPSEFFSVTVRFVFEDGRSEILQLAHGSALEMDMVPEIPEKAGYTGYWAGLEEANLSHMDFDVEFYAQYREKAVVIESAEKDENGRPVLFAQGVFDDDSEITFKRINKELGDGEKSRFIDGLVYEIVNGTADTLRFNIGSEYADYDLEVRIFDNNGDARTEQCRMEGSYVVFSVNENDSAFMVMDCTQNYTWYIVAGGVVVLCAIVIIILAKRKKK